MLANAFFAFLAIAGLLVGPATADTTSIQPKRAVIQVRGLSCPVCAHRLEKVLVKLPEAKSAKVSLKKGQAVVTFAPTANVTDQQLSQTVRDAGFVPGKIEWRKTTEAENSGKE